MHSKDDFLTKFVITRMITEWLSELC